MGNVILNKSAKLSLEQLVGHKFRHSSALHGSSYNLIIFSDSLDFKDFRLVIDTFSLKYNIYLGCLSFVCSMLLR